MLNKYQAVFTYFKTHYELQLWGWAVLMLYITEIVSCFSK